MQRGLKYRAMVTAMLAVLTLSACGKSTEITEEKAEEIETEQEEISQTESKDKGKQEKEVDGKRRNPWLVLNNKQANKISKMYTDGIYRAEEVYDNGIPGSTYTFEFNSNTGEVLIEELHGSSAVDVEPYMEVVNGELTGAEMRQYIIDAFGAGFFLSEKELDDIGVKNTTVRLSAQSADLINMISTYIEKPKWFIDGLEEVNSESGIEESGYMDRDRDGTITEEEYTISIMEEYMTSLMDTMKEYIGQ